MVQKTHKHRLTRRVFPYLLNTSTELQQLKYCQIPKLCENQIRDSTSDFNNFLRNRLFNKQKQSRYRQLYHVHCILQPGRVAQSLGHLPRKSEVLGSIPGLATYFRVSCHRSKRDSCLLLAKVCARSTRGLSLPRKSVVRLTGRANMTVDVKQQHKTTSVFQVTKHFLEYNYFYS